MGRHQLQYIIFNMDETLNRQCLMLDADVLKRGYGTKAKCRQEKGGLNQVFFVDILYGRRLSLIMTSYRISLHCRYCVILYYVLLCYFVNRMSWQFGSSSRTL